MKDKQGDTLARQNAVLVCGDVSDDFLIRTDKAVYRGGESVKLTALSGTGAPIFVDFIQDGKERVSLLSATIDVRDGQGSLTLDLPPDVSGTLEMCAYRLGQPQQRGPAQGVVTLDNSGLAVRKSRVVYVQPASDLKITANLDQKEYRPGGKASLNLKLTDSKDRPVPGAISLAAVDEAVFAVLPQAPGKEKSYFTLEQKLLQPIQAIYPWSPERRPGPDGEARDQFEQALFAATARNVAVPAAPQPPRGRRGVRVEMAPAMPPDGAESPSSAFASKAHSLQVQSYQEKVQEMNRLRNQRLDWVTVGWLGLLALTLLNGYIALWCFVSTSTLLKIHLGAAIVLVPASMLFLCILAGLIPAQMAAKSAAVAERDMAVAAEARAMQMDGLPGALPPMAPGGGGFNGMEDGRGAANRPGEAPAPRVRKEFPETLLVEAAAHHQRPGRIAAPAGRPGRQHHHLAAFRQRHLQGGATGRDPDGAEGLPVVLCRAGPARLPDPQ